jgi:ligand-binding sensor domain-containing protein
MKFFYILCTITLFAISSLSAQQNWLSFTNGKVIKAVAFENQFVWVGTTGGLVRVDTTNGNARFYNKTYEAIPDNWVSSLAIDAKGGKWIGTLAAGLGYYDEKKPFGKEWAKYTFLDGLPSDEIRTLAMEGNILWVGTKKGLVKYDGTTWETFNILNSNLPDNDITTIKIDKNKTKWIGTLKGIAVLDNAGNMTRYNDEDINNKPVSAISFDVQGAPLLALEYNLVKLVNKDWVVQKSFIAPEYIDNAINHVATDAKGSVWVATSRGGIFQQNGAEWKAINRQNSRLPSNDVNLLEIDSKGSRWIGTNNEGLFKYTGATAWTQYFTSSSAISDNIINDLKSDRNGNIWFGTKNAGILSKYAGDIWQTYDKTNSPIPPDALIISVGLNATDGTKWFGTDTKGVFKYDGTTWTNYTPEKSPLPGAQVSVIAFDRRNNYWFGTTDGLAKFDGRSGWTVYNLENSKLPANSITSLAFDKSNILWVGTRNGIVRMVNDNFELLNNQNSQLPSDAVTTIYVDKRNNKWIGTSDKGLVRIDSAGTAYTKFGIAELGDERVKAIEYDNDGMLWVGTEVGGLARFDGKNWKRFTVKNSGLPLNHISALTIDQRGQLWIGTAGGGMAVYSAKGIKLNTAIADTEIATASFEVFPNPTTDVINLHIDFLAKSEIDISLYDMSGRKIRQFIKDTPTAIGKMEYNFSLFGVENGIYFLEVKSAVQRMTKKVVLR